MLSKTRIGKILGKCELTEEQLRVLRNEMYALAEMFFEEISPGSGSKEHSWVIDSTTKNNGH